MVMVVVVVEKNHLRLFFSPSLRLFFSPSPSLLLSLSLPRHPLRRFFRIGVPSPRTVIGPTQGHSKPEGHRQMPHTTQAQTSQGSESQGSEGKCGMRLCGKTSRAGQEWLFSRRRLQRRNTSDVCSATSGHSLRLKTPEP